MNNLKYILTFILSLNIIVNCIYSKEKFRIEASAGVNYNHYNSNFNGFPNYDCCGHFTNGIGIGYSLSFSGIYQNLLSLSNLTLNYFTTISFIHIPGDFEQQDYFADVIINDKAYEAVSLHTLKSIVNAFALKTGVDVSNVFGIEPLSIQVGTALNFPLEATFQQKEELISPENAYFENFQRIRNNLSGNIINLRNPLLGIEITSGWKFKISNGYYLKPYLSAEIPIQNYIKNLEWKASRFTLGIALGYFIPGPKPKLPDYPPLLDFPKPAIPSKLEPIEAEIIVYENGSPIPSNTSDTIKIFKTTKKIVEQFPMPTIIFYNRNDFLFGEEPIESTVEFKTLYESNRLILASVLEYLKANHNARISLLCSQSNDEIPNICSQRLARLSEFFIKNGLGDRLEKQQTFVAKHKKNIPELLAEERFVQIVLEDGNSVVYSKRNVKTDSSIVFPNLKVEINFNPDVKANIYSEVICTNNKYEIVGKTFDLEISKIHSDSSNPIDSIIIRAKVETLEEFPRETEIKRKLYIKTIENDFIEYRDFNPFEGDNYILVGLFPFDSDEPYWTKPQLQKIARELIAKGKKVTIVGSVDNIGNEDHNQRLAIQRAKKINRILNSALPTKIMEASNRQDNSTPFERILNRSAWLLYEN